MKSPYRWYTSLQISSRSREGAWIEISRMQKALLAAAARRSREGAWIEIMQDIKEGIRGVRRSREGAWIEISHYQSAMNP